MTTESPEYANSANHTTNENDELVVELYDANQGKTPRTGGPYLDEVEREQAELIRSRRENRDPDFDNPPASAGTVLVTKSQLVERDTDKSHFSDTLEVQNKPVASYVAQQWVDESDPTQPDFDNDMSRIAALDAGLRMQELSDKAKNQDVKPSEPVSQDAPSANQNEHPVTDASTAAADDANTLTTDNTTQGTSAKATNSSPTDKTDEDYEV